MRARGPSRSGALQWTIVLVVGIVVVALVLVLNLIPRLSSGQKVLDAARPAFNQQRVAGDRAAVNLVSNIFDLSNPIATAQGGGAGEVPTIVSYVAQAQHISDAQALALLQKDFPHTTALLQAIPLSAVTAELPGLEAFLEKTLSVTPAQLTAALRAKFPALYQSIANLPAVTDGWNAVPNLHGLTRFDGTPVINGPQLRDYFSSDLIPVLEQQRGNFDSLDGTTAVDWIAPLLLIVGGVVILLAIVMILRNLRGVYRKEALATAIVVPVVGVVVVALVLAISLIPRVSDGQALLEHLKPAFAVQRVQGDRGGISFISKIVDTLDPITTPAGGGAAEVPKLVAFVSSKSGMSPSAVLAALKKSFPHTTALLQMIPISSVTVELPALVGFLSPAVVSSIPALLPTVLNAQAVTTGWDNIPGTASLTDFKGAPVRTIPQARTYFSNDVIPVLEQQRRNYVSVDSTSNIDFLAPLVLIIGVIVILYGLLMVALARRVGERPEKR